MPRMTVNEDRCKGCGLCVLFCPQKIIELQTHKLNARGYNPAIVTDMSKCTGCALCATMCPDVAIVVER